MSHIIKFTFMHVVVRNEIWHGKTRFLNAIGDFSSVLIAKHYRNTQNNMNIWTNTHGSGILLIIYTTLGTSLANWRFIVCVCACRVMRGWHSRLLYHISHVLLELLMFGTCDWYYDYMGNGVNTQTLHHDDRSSWIKENGWKSVDLLDGIGMMNIWWYNEAM